MESIRGVSGALGAGDLWVQKDKTLGAALGREEQGEKCGERGLRTLEGRRVNQVW